MAASRIVVVVVNTVHDQPFAITGENGIRNQEKSKPS